MANLFINLGIKDKGKKQKWQIKKLRAKTMLYV